MSVCARSGSETRFLSMTVGGGLDGFDGFNLHSLHSASAQGVESVLIFVSDFVFDFP